MYTLQVQEVCRQGTGDTGNARRRMKHTSTGEMGGSTIYRGGDHGESYGAPAGGLIREACGTSGRGLSGTGYNNCCRFVDATAWPILLLAAIFFIYGCTLLYSLCRI